MVFSIASANACILHVSIQSWGRLWTVASAFSGDASDSAERRPPRWNLNAAWSSKLMSDDLGLSWFIRFKIDRTIRKNIGMPRSLRIEIALWISDLSCGLPDSYANCLIERAGIGNLPIYRFTATSKRKQNSLRERNWLDPQDPLGFTLSHQRFGGCGPEVVGAPNHESVLCSEISRGRKVYCHLLPFLAAHHFHHFHSSPQYEF